MTRGVFVDSAGWVAYFDRHDQAHQDALSVWSRFRQEKTPLLTTDYVLDETITYLRVRAGHAVSVRAGLAILGSQGVRVLFLSEEALRAAWERYQRDADKSYSFTDVTSFLMMEQLEIRQAFTFDRHFTQAGFQILSGAGG